MAMGPEIGKIAELFHFHPKRWWDPVPEWFITHLDKNVLRDLALIQVELHKTILEGELKAVDRTLATLKGK